jgi:hypothetical protein
LTGGRVRRFHVTCIFRCVIFFSFSSMQLFYIIFFPLSHN